MSLFIIFSLGAVQPVRAEPLREFVMSATYGTLAGTLVGVASLAFTTQPGENLRNIARGASLGLYAGILLGFYVVYVVPSQGQPGDLPPEEPVETKLQLPQLEPLVSSNGIEGMALRWSLDF